MAAACRSASLIASTRLQSIFGLSLAVLFMVASSFPWFGDGPSVAHHTRRCDLGLTRDKRGAYYICRNVMEEPLESAITTKGQATIPKAIREHLGLKSGDRIKFFIHPDGSVVLLPKRSASVLRGIVKPRRRRASIEEMKEAAAAGAAADALPRRR